MRRANPGLLLLPLLAAVGCGGGGGSAPAASTSQPLGAAYSDLTDRSGGDATEPIGEVAGDGQATGGTHASDPPADPPDAEPVDTGETGSISGTVAWSGKVLTMPLLTAVAGTTGCHTGADTPRNESIIVNDGRLQNVFVYISKGVDAARVPPVPGGSPTLDQRGCIFHPHVQGMRAGQKLIVANDDPVSHNVHVSARRNDAPNVTVGALVPDRPGASLELFFGTQEVAVRIACDIHPWMNAYLGVVDHPWFAVTGPDGTFHIENVPPGRYDLTFWHESKRVQFTRRLRGVVVSSEQDTPVDAPSFKLK